MIGKKGKDKEATMTDLYAMFLIAMKIASMATKGFLIDFDYVENENFYVHILKDNKEWFSTGRQYFQQPH